MEINKEAKAKYLEGLQMQRKMLDRYFANAINETEISHTVEGIMSIKKRLLSDLIIGLPLYATNCYFCALHHDVIRDGCGECEYGKIHGICASSTYGEVAKKKLPTWDKLRNIRNRMESIVMEEYFGIGERYDDS